MGSVAAAMSERGFTVTGSDENVYPPMSTFLEKRGISADTALRLGRYFGTTALLWINLQARYDLEVARDAIADKLEAEIKPLKRAA